MAFGGTTAAVVALLWCPGLTNVVRDVTLSLWNLYGVRKISGIRMGFEGFSNWTSVDQKEAPIMLTPASVANIHHSGGTILGANRGGFDLDRSLRSSPPVACRSST